MSEDRITDRDILRIFLTIFLGFGASGFVKSSGLLEGLAVRLGGSMPAAYLVWTVIVAVLLLWGW